MRFLLLSLSFMLVSCSSSSNTASSAEKSTAPASAPAPTQSSAPPSQSDQREFVEKAAAEQGAIKTASGMIYKVIKPGTGESPKATDMVTVNYRGTLTNGIEFDSSYTRGEPISFPLTRVIACWTEGLQKMKVGGKSQLICPANIAYGEGGRPPVIPPNSTLVFEVELLKIGS